MIRGDGHTSLNVHFPICREDQNRVSQGNVLSLGHRYSVIDLNTPTLALPLEGGGNLTADVKNLQDL